MNSNSIFTRRHAGADAAASAPATTSAAAEDAFKNDPTATLEGVRGKDVTKAAKALLKDSVKRGGGSIQMRDVVKIYPGSTVHALDDFNLDIKPGEMVVLLGGSGCGKSTALRSLAGLEDIQGGRIMVGGQDVTGVPVNKREMAMVFQAYSLFPHMTALENVEFGLEVRGMGKAERRKIAMEQLELVGLADQAKKYTQQMSGGQQQRVAIARALATENGKTMAEKAHKLGVELVEYITKDEALQPSVFTDVKEGAYYVDAVNWAADKKVTSGKTETTFAPNDSCTRAQAVTFLWRAAGSPEPTASEMTFTDVKADSYYDKAVLWAVENKITSGMSDTLFAPDATCSRSQIVTFLYRMQNSPKSKAENPFTDVKADAYYANAVLWAVENCVTTCASATTFDPAGDCTRGQIVTLLYRCLSK